jgi:hypothetical protein
MSWHFPGHRIRSLRRRCGRDLIVVGTLAHMSWLNEYWQSQAELRTSNLRADKR